jgi:hypothetical protein
MNGDDATSPWPEEGPPDDARRRDEPATDTPTDTPAGSKGVALASAVASVGFWVLLPILFVVGLYTYVTVYAIVKALGSAPEGANPTVVILGVIGLTTLFLVLLAGGLALIGRAGDPKKRRR